MTITSRLIKQEARRQAFIPSEDGSIALRLLVSIRFQVLLNPLAGVLFTFPSRYLFTIGRQRVFSLGEWSPQLPTGFRVSRSTQDTASSLNDFRLQGFHLLWPGVPAGSPNRQIGNSTHAVLQPLDASIEVWALPISLAATLGISFDLFSTRY